MERTYRIERPGQTAWGCGIRSDDVERIRQEARRATGWTHDAYPEWGDTTAEAVAEIAGGDGQVWVHKGQTLDYYCARSGGEAIQDGPDETEYRWVFGDGSAIGAQDGIWDLAYAECGCWHESPDDDCNGEHRK